jgi:hypothetical protein
MVVATLWFIQQAARHYSIYSAASYGELWPRRAGFIPHMAGGLVAISTGLIQQVSLATDIAVRDSIYCRIGR